MRVLMPFRLPLQDEVELHSENTTIGGVVRNCTCRSAIEFHVGIEVAESSQLALRVLKRTFLYRI